MPSLLSSIFQAAYGFPTITAELSYLGTGLGGLTALALTKNMMAGVALSFRSEDGAKRPDSVFRQAIGVRWRIVVRMVIRKESAMGGTMMSSASSSSLPPS